jgi:SAM-dependent methyltransferase
MSANGHDRDAAYWEGLAASWSPTRRSAALRAYSDQVNRALLDRWLPSSAGVVLKTDLFDEAVGEGLVSVLAARADRVVGIDVSPSFVAEARRRNPTLDGQVADVRELPFETATFDVVVSNSTLDHFETLADLDMSLRELARVLRPEGTLLLTLDNAANPSVWLRNHLPRRLLERLRLVPYPVGVTVGPRGIRKALARAGLLVEETTTVMHVPRVLVRAAGWRSPRLLAFERAGAAPTRALTGQFVAARARRPAAGAVVAGPARDRRVSVLRRLVARGLSATVYRRLELVALPLDALPAPVEPAVPVTYGFLEQGDVEALEMLRPGLGAAARDRFGRGERCFAARAPDGRIVSVRWVARGMARIEFVGCALPLGEGEAFNFDTWSDPSVRGLGVASSTGDRLYRALAAEGVTVVLRAVWPENAAGMRNAAREGFARIGVVGCVRLGRRRRYYARRDGNGREQR